MGADFPAAHSMDTHWFAVDQGGQVALFFTSETGFMPLDATQVEGHELIQLYRRLTGKEPPGLGEDDYIEDWEGFLDALCQLGFFDYNYINSFGDPDGLLAPYTLWGEPGMPIHVDQLPPDLRQQCLRCRFESVSFGEDDRLQPLELVPEAQWFSYWEGDCAYLTADGSAVRPFPGREDKYRDFCKKYAGNWPAHRKGARIENLPDLPPKEDADGR
jgi:hypothetical protein